MDKLKAARKPIRALITRTCNEIEALLQADGFDEIQALNKDGKLNELLEKIQPMDQDILDVLLEQNDEVVYDEEINVIDRYNSEIRVARIKLDREFRKIGRQQPGNTHEASSEYSTVVSCKQKRKFKLPKIELMKFSGKLIEWLSWWSQFEKIHKDEELHTTDKFEYLRQAMVPNSKSKELVDSFPATEDNYPKVIKAITERFGKKKLLIQVYVRELFRMGLQNINHQIEITSVFDVLVSHVRALESLDVTMEQAALFLYPMVESSLPDDILIAWQRSALYEKDGSAENPPKTELDFLFQFLQQEVERNEQRQMVRVSLLSKGAYDGTDKKKEEKRDERKDKYQPTAASLFNGQFKPPSCIFCDKTHESKDCASTEFWTLDEMNKKIREKRACFNCLKQNHSAKTCNTFVKCHVCAEKHFTVMCPELKEKKLTKNSNHPTNSSAGANFDCSQDVLLKTIMVLVVVNGNKRLARLLFDDGSQRSYATKSLMKKMGSQPFKQEYMRNILFDGSTTKLKSINNHKVDIQGLEGNKNLSLILREREVLGGRVTRIPKGYWLDEFAVKGIQFNDLSLGKDGIADIDIVIGSDYWGKIMKGTKESLPCGLSAFESIWGWTLCGPIPQTSQTDHYISMFMADESVKNLWSLEVIGITDPIEKQTQAQEEMAAMDIFRTTLQQDVDGRYKVKLPWVDELKLIPNNRHTATSRLMSATKKLNINQQFKTYDDIIKAWYNEGFIEKVIDVNEKEGHYLPHHPVFKDSVTTPVRPVFDASCKTHQNFSLNDYLYKGPNFIESLPDKLIRFRMKWLGALSDIRKAFQMIEVDEDDREYLQFLWWEDDTQSKIVVWRHCRVVFGLKCSPFLLAAVLEEHLSKVQDERKKTKEELKKALYIDNCVTSFDSHEEYKEFKEKSVQIMAEGKFELRQWESASPSSLEEIEGPPETKVLGMIWEKETDTLRIQVPELTGIEKLTKRTIASVLHKFFDPLGIISPVLVLPKIMLQQAWKQKSSWDKELPEIWKEQFQKWHAETALLNEIKIPRLCTIPKASNHQLHTFTDASKDAYTAVVFLRSEYEKEVIVQLIQSRSRVAPISTATINRLELMGCVIGCRLAQHSLESMELDNVQRYFWCDSTTAIAWIQRNTQWGTFVHNRVKRIRDATEAQEWRYVPGKLNPADLPSRGCNGSELLRAKWWEGPSWLKLSSENWPNKQMKFNEEEINSEIKGKSSVSMFSVDKESWFAPKHSKFSTKVHVMAWILRFCYNSKNPNSRRNHKFLSIPELREAEIAIIRTIQMEVELGPKEEKQIKKNMAPTTINDKGLIRLKTPITKRMDTEGFRYPYLLPNKHPFVRDLISEMHINYCHAGAQFIMSKLREKYWITQGRKTISNVLKHCVTCQRFNSRRMDTIPAALPETRVKSGEIFDSTGVDLFGYLTLKNGSKVWVVLYTCAVYRAVYLDIVKSINVKEFIKSLKKFIFRFGRPLDMLSDNGTNFTGTANLLRTIDVAELLKECEVQKIRWNFNPPTAPWWGGFFERMVRSVKEPLRKILRQSSINLEQLDLLLMEITTVINDRPLTTLTEDPEDLEPLTPNMFLRGTKNATFPEEEAITHKTLRSEWERIKIYKELLQTRFRKEYLGQLVEHKRTNKSSVIKVGDIVLVENDKKKRYQWPMGRVMEIMPSSDGEIRVAKIRTRGGCINRPLRRLYPLEMNDSRPDMSSDVSNVHLVTNAPQEEEEEVIEEDNIFNEDNSETEKITKSGRKVKKPIRYTGWNK